MEVVKENPYGDFDRYELRHYLEHLEKAGRGIEVHRVLLAESKYINHTGRRWPRLRSREDNQLSEATRVANAWYDAHEEIGETESYLSDVARCWRLAEEATTNQLSDNDSISSISLEVRYALISACVNNLASNVPPPLLAGAIAQGLITIPQAIAYARQTPDLKQKVLALIAVGPELKEAPRKALMAEALSTAQSLQDQTKRAATLVALADVLDETQLLEAVGLTSQILFTGERLKAVSALARRLSGQTKKQVLEGAMTLVEELSDDHDRAEILTLLAGEFLSPQSEETFERAISLLEGAEGNYRQGEAIEKFIRAAPVTMLARAHGLALKLEMEESRVTALSALPGRLASQGNEEGALKFINSISPEKYGRQRALALSESGPCLSQANTRNAVKMAFEILTDQHRSMALAGMAPYVGEDLLKRLLTHAKGVKDGGARAQLLTALSLRLSGIKKDDTLREAAAALKENISYDDDNVLTRLVPLLPQPILKILFDSARQIDDRAQQVQATAALLSSLDTGLKATALAQLIAKTGELKDQSERADANLRLIPVLVEMDRVSDALKLAWSIRPWTQFAKGISSVLPYLSDSEKNEQLKKVIILLENARDEVQQTNIIMELAPELSGEWLSRALTLVLHMQWEGGRIRALSSLVPYVSAEFLRKHSFSEANRVKDGFSGSKIEIAIATRLASLGDTREALDFALSNEDELSRTNIFEGIIAYLPEELLYEVLRVSQSFTFDGRKYSVFAMLAPRFTEVGNEQAAEYLIAQIQAPLQAALAAARVAQYAASAPLRARAIEHALTIIKNMQQAFGEGQGWWQAEVIKCVAPYLSPDTMAQACRLAVSIEEEIDRREALSSLVPFVAQLHLVDLYPIWTSSLHYLAMRSRRHLLSDVTALTPIILRIGGTTAVSAGLKAISDVGRWW